MANGAAMRRRARTTWAATTRWTPPTWRAATSRCRPTCTGRRCRLRLSEEDSCALRFLIESLNDDGYLEESLESLAAGLAGDDAEQQEELVHRFTVALRLLHHLDPVGVGARSLAECLSLQLKAMQAEGDAHAACATALRICAQPMDLLARRDVKRLSQLCGDSEAQVRAAHRADHAGWSPSRAGASSTSSATSSFPTCWSPRSAAARRRAFACSSIPT